MPMNGYSIGRDVTITITLPDGTALDLGKITKFTSKQEADTQDIKGLDGRKDRLRFFGGWTGSFDAERRGPDVDAYFAQLEANYYAGGDEPPATITETILEPSGAVSQFRYERVVLSYDDAGDKLGDKSVSAKVSFFAQRRVQQA